MCNTCMLKGSITKYCLMKSGNKIKMSLIVSYYKSYQNKFYSGVSSFNKRVS